MLRTTALLSVSALVTVVSLAQAQGLPYPSYTPYQIKGISVG
jgi:hypothetical protein